MLWHLNVAVTAFEMFVQIGIISINYQSIWLKFYKAGQNQKQKPKEHIVDVKEEIAKAFFNDSQFHGI